MLTNGRKKVEKAMSLKKEAKDARDKASGTTFVSFNRSGKVLSRARKASSSRVVPKLDSVLKIDVKVKKVDSDAYNVLAKRAKLAGLKGKSAEAAISKALKTVSTRMSNDRNRTANRAESIARREAKKRKNTNLS
jgi:ElaB/YqjD/DUF883 family membrane-anchored ribosome-binding protein